MEDIMFENLTLWIVLPIVLGIGFTLLMIVVSLAASYFLFRWLRKSFGSGAVKNGVSAPATILRVWDTGTTVNDNPMVGFQLEGCLRSGKLFRSNVNK
jgi:hypothetical protein